MTANILQQPLEIDNVEINETEWDYCQIEYQLINDGRGYTQHSGPGNKLVWFRFIARASGPAGKYIAARSPKTPLPNMMGTTWSPDQRNGGHQNVLHTFVETLQRDGWELQRGTNGAWWSKQLKRPTSKAKAQNSLWQKLSKWLAQFF